MARLIRCLPRCSLGFSVTQQDPDFTVLQNLNPSRKIEIVNYIDTPRIRVIGTFEQYWRASGRDLTRKLTRRLRHATEEGIQPEVMTFEDPGGVARCLPEYGTLEATGRKGKEGTAVTAENSQGLFYPDMLESFATG